MTLTRQQKIAASILAVYWPALFIMAHTPVPGVIRQADVSDKSLHFLAYLILAFLLRFSVSSEKKVSWRKAVPWLVLIVMIVYGILDEWLQGYVAGRSPDARDLVADIAGTVVCLILCSFLTFWPAALVVAATVIFSITNVERVNFADLLPVANALFHLFAYAVFTAVWIQCTYLFPSARACRIKWLISAFAGPVGFLVFVKLCSVIVGKDIVLSDMVISFGAITAVVTVFYPGFKSRIAEKGNDES